MDSRLWTRKIGVCLCLCLACTGARAWWPAADPQEPYRHLMPAARDFPGTVPEQVARISRTVHFSQHPRDLGVLRLGGPPKNWQSTGLYRAPHDPLKVTVRALAGAATLAGPKPHISLIIGAHDSLPSGAAPDGHGPAEARSIVPIRDGEQLYWGGAQDGDWAAGLLYIASDAVGDTAFDITVTGAVQAPWFKLGRDSPTHWQETLRHAPAPWAELEGQHAVLTVPSRLIRDLEDPTPIILFYDQVVKDACAVVGLSDHPDDPRDRVPDLPFRFVLDPALAERKNPPAAFSGYPNKLNPMAHGDPGFWLVPGSTRLRAFLLHILSHNLRPVDALCAPPGAQRALGYLMEYGDQSRQGCWFLATRQRWPFVDSDFFYAVFPILSVTDAVALHLFGGDNWRHDNSIWVNDAAVSLALKRAFMLKLVRHLSHAFIARLFQRLRHTPEDALPARNSLQQKTDFFFETLCAVTEQDLTLFFQSWYLPVSSDAYQRVAEQGYPVPAWVRHDGL